MRHSRYLLTLLAGCALLASCTAPAPRPVASEEADLSILTFNIRYDNPGDGENAWPRRADWVTETIEAIDPDVFGLQEALLHQIEHIAARLPEYRWIGVGRDDGRAGGEFFPSVLQT